MGLTVSTMAQGQQDNDGTKGGDWKELQGLHAAAKEGDVEGVRQSLSQGVDVNLQNEEGMTALHWACEQGHQSVVEVLLQANAKLDIKEMDMGMTALHFAIPTASIAEMLIVAGASAYAVDSDGVSCLEMCEDEDQGPDRIRHDRVRSLIKNHQSLKIST